MYTVLIKGGEVFDGSGREAFRADIALQGDKIAAIGEQLKEPAELVVDADGLAVAQGSSISIPTPMRLFSAAPCPRVNSSRG